MKRRWKIVLIVVVAVVIALVAIVAIQKRKGQRTEVTVAEVQRMDLVSNVTANGKIEAQRKVDLSADVMGQIVNIGVREGDVVEKGDFLLQIDQTQLAADTAGAEASLRALLNDRDAARARLSEAEAIYARAQKNYEANIISQAELDAARSAIDSAVAQERATVNRVEQARAALSGARDTLSKTTIRAPIPGIVTALPVDEGEVAVIGTMNNPGTVLMTISDMGVVEAVMEVDETDVPAVGVGQSASVTIDAYPNRTFEGTVVRVGSSPITASALGSTTEAVNFEVRIQLENPPADLRPGFSATAEILTGTRQNAVAIPIQALVIREKPLEEGAPPGARPVDEEGVFFLRDGGPTLGFAPVETGLTGDTMIEIVRGVEPGQKIVTGPFKALREIEEGEEVKVGEEGRGEESRK